MSWPGICFDNIIMGIALRGSKAGASNNCKHIIHCYCPVMPRFLQDIFFNQYAAEVVRPCQQSQLTGRDTFTEPGGLYVLKIVKQ